MTDCRSLVLILGILKIKAMRGYRQTVHDNYSRHKFDTDSNATIPFFQCTAVCKQLADKARRKGRAAGPRRRLQHLLSTSIYIAAAHSQRAHQHLDLHGHVIISRCPAASFRCHRSSAAMRAQTMASGSCWRRCCHCTITEPGQCSPTAPVRAPGGIRNDEPARAVSF